MSKNEEKICGIQIKEAFAHPTFAVSQLTNPTRILIGEEARRFLTLCGVDTEKASDYELFAAFVANIPSFQGSGVYELFCESMDMFFDVRDISCDSDPCELWRVTCDKIEEKCREGSGISDLLRFDLLPTAVLPSRVYPANYNVFVKSNTLPVKAAEKRCISVDISEIEFARTDRYHSEKGYKAYLSGDEGAKDIFLSGVLYEVFAEAKRDDVEVLLYAGDKYSSLVRMIEYFSTRGELPRVRIFAKEKILFDVASELCGKQGASNIRCGILYETGDTAESIAEKIKKIARIYPVGALLAGGSATDSPAFAARHNILRRGIERALN